MRLVLFLPLTGCLAGATASGTGDLLITEYGDASPGTDQTAYVEIGNPTDHDVDLADYTLGVDTDGPSSLLEGVLAPRDVHVVEVAGGDFQAIFNRPPDATIPSSFGFTPDEVRLYLADGSGFGGAATRRGDATFQDVISGDDVGRTDLHWVHLCRRDGVPRGRGRFDATEWTVTDTFAIDASELDAVASPGDFDCP